MLDSVRARLTLWHVGVLALEIGPGQAGSVVELLGAHGFRTEVHEDLAGHQRVVIGRR